MNHCPLKTCNQTSSFCCIFSLLQKEEGPLNGSLSCYFYTFPAFLFVAGVESVSAGIAQRVGVSLPLSSLKLLTQKTVCYKNELKWLVFVSFPTETDPDVAVHDGKGRTAFRRAQRVPTGTVAAWRRPIWTRRLLGVSSIRTWISILHRTQGGWSADAVSSS